MLEGSIKIAAKPETQGCRSETTYATSQTVEEEEIQGHDLQLLT